MMNPEALITHVLKPLVSHPEAMEFNVIEGTAVIVIEMRVHDEDVSVLTNDESALLGSLQHLLTVSASERKPSLELLNIAE